MTGSRRGLARQPCYRDTDTIGNRRTKLREKRWNLLPAKSSSGPIDHPFANSLNIKNVLQFAESSVGLNPGFHLIGRQKMK